MKSSTNAMVNLSITEEEAQWLRGVMRKPLRIDVKNEWEWIVDKTNRENLFNALDLKYTENYTDPFEFRSPPPTNGKLIMTDKITHLPYHQQRGGVPARGLGDDVVSASKAHFITQIKLEGDNIWYRLSGDTHTWVLADNVNTVFDDEQVTSDLELFADAIEAIEDAMLWGMVDEHTDAIDDSVPNVLQRLKDRVA